jgi:hypothetical protein
MKNRAPRVNVSRVHQQYNGLGSIETDSLVLSADNYQPRAKAKRLGSYDCTYSRQKKRLSLADSYLLPSQVHCPST